MQKTVPLIVICLVLSIVTGCASGRAEPEQTSANTAQAGQLATAFGQGGQIKMLYDRRQRPQSVYLHDKVHIVFNAGGEAGASLKAKTRPMAVARSQGPW